MKSFFEALEHYGNNGTYPYHMPGHKRRLKGFLPETLVKVDITEIEGFDNLHHARGILRELQKQASDLYGSDESFYLVGGSTCGILAAISACVPKGGHILMARNCHKAAYHAAYLRELQVHYLEPDIIEGFGIPDRIRVNQVREALDRYPEVTAVLLVSPTYEGRISEISEIAELVHERGKLLVVDEAHGAHLGFAKGFSDNSVRKGADVVIHSVHKTLPAMTQTALLHVKGDRVDLATLRRFLQIYQSSSPSYVLMASIDNALRVVREQGQVLFADLQTRYEKMIGELQACKQLRFLSPEKNIQDIGKLVISTARAGITGKELYELLLERYKLQLEMACGNYALAMFTIGDSEEGYERLTKALLELDKELDEKAKGSKKVREHEDARDNEKAWSEKDWENEDAGNTMEVGDEYEIRDIEEASDGYNPGTQKVVYPLSKAWDMEKNWVQLDYAEGRVAGEFVTLYPPGIPMFAPGEEITKEHVNLIRNYMKKNFELEGIQFLNDRPCVCCVTE